MQAVLKGVAESIFHPPGW